MKKILFLGLAAILLTGCFSQNKNNNSEDNSDFNTDDDPISDVADSGEANVYDDYTFTEEEISAPEEYDGTNLEAISEPGKYYYSGDVHAIKITAEKNKTIYLFFNGVTINTEESIALASENKIALYIIVLNGSTNSISNQLKDTNAVHIKGDIHILGNGTLNIESKMKNGLKASKDLYISGKQLTLNVTGANHAIAARSIYATDASINVIAKGKDGLQLEVDSDITEFDIKQGFAYLKDITFTADTYGDGIQANTYLYISGGNYNITTHGEFVSYSQSNKDQYGLEDDDFKYIHSNDTYQRVGKKEIRSLNSSYYALTQSTKGIKVSEIETDSGYLVGDYDIQIAHGAKITVDSFDDCVHSNYGDVNVVDSNLFLSSYDDGIHADYNTNIMNSHIEISKSFEGLEGATVTVDGEKTNLVIYSSDDGINAASDYSTDNNIYIKNGYLRVYASGDGLDANTALYLQGGKVIVEGPGQDNGSLDAENIYFQGSQVFACSTNGMREKMSATQNTFVYQGSTKMYANDEIKIVDSNKNVIYKYTLKQSCTQIIFSSSDLKLNETYKIMNGSTTITSIKMTSVITSVGSSSGGQGGGPGGEPHR